MKDLNKKFSILFMEAGASGQGGSFVTLLNLIRMLCKNQHTVHVVLWNDSPFVAQYQQAGAKVFIIPHRFYGRKKSYLWLYNKMIACSLRFFPKLMPYIELLFQRDYCRYLEKYIRAHQITILHLNNQPVRNFIGFWLAKKVKIPVISHLRTLNGYSFSKAHVNFISKLNCKMIAVSSSAAEYWKNLDIPADWIRVLPDPYEGEYQLENLNKKLGKSIVYLGRLEERKGLDFLLETFALLLKEDPAFRLFLIGEGSKKIYLQAYAKKIGIDAQITFLGYVHEAKKILNQFDLLVFPSEQEGFGRVLLEAMAMRLPIVATRVAGIADAIQHEYNGLLVNYGNVSEFKEAILRLYKEADLRIRLIENGWKCVTQNYAENNFYKEIFACYQGE